MGCGLPVITTFNAGSVVRDGIDGFIVPIRDVEALKTKILLLYRNEELRLWMGRNARDRATEYDWKNYRQRISKCLKELYWAPLKKEKG
jgi:glycosyltransferase involved in cell wall biosynthesis